MVEAAFKLFEQYLFGIFGFLIVGAWISYYLRQKCNKQKYQIVNIIFIILLGISLWCTLLLLMYDMTGERAEKHQQEYIYQISDFDKTAPVGMYIVKRYKNMEDFKHYKVYGEDAGYTLYKVDNKGSVVEVTFKKND